MKTDRRDAERLARLLFVGELCQVRVPGEALLYRRAELERPIAAAIPGSAWEREVALPRRLRGIDTLSAVGLCAEIGDFRRFARAVELRH